MRLKFVYIFALIIISIANLKSQDEIQRQVEFADNLFNQKLYYDAITEYKRLLFFDVNRDYGYYANTKIAEAYKGGAKFDEAIQFFKEAELSTLDQEEKFKAEEEIIKVNILRGTTERSFELINQLSKEQTDSEKLKMLDYWRAWTYMFANKWEIAHEILNIYPEFNELSNYCKQVIDEKYSVNFAKLLSYILPGAGQIYTGEYLSGTMSLAWNVLFGYLTINSFVEKRAFDGFAIGTLLWMRFYRGNIQNAERFAENKNIEIANAKLKYIQQNYQGLKPWDWMKKN